jgi:catechol 2,3-dioxygenase-like lactoylglutathione lyase family enzyme
MTAPVVYREVQRFRTLTLWLLVGGIAALLWYGFIRQVVLGQPFGSRPSSDAELAVGWAVFGLGLPALFWGVRLVTEVDDAGVRIRFWPFPGRRIRWPHIRDAQALTYRPLREFGGWGLRWGRGRRAYSVSGDRGVELVLHRGGRIVIGSQDPAALHAAIIPHIIGTPIERG